MSYELYRTSVLTNLSGIMPVEQMQRIMDVLDEAATQFDFKKKELALSTVVNGIPNVVRDYIAAKATENLKKATLQNYFYLLRNFFLTIGKDYDKIETNDVRRFLQYYQMQRNQTDRTKCQNKNYLKSFYDWLINAGLATKNPVSAIGVIKYHEKRRYVLTPLEVEMMRYACENLRERAIFNVLYSSGIRVSELCNLRKEDLDFERRELHVKQGKGGKDRITYFNASAVLSLKAYFASRNDDSPYVFVRSKGEPVKLSKRAVEVVIGNIADRAGLGEKGISPHNLRHTFATAMISNGCPVEMVQMMLGHSKISTTMIYAHIAQEDVRRSYEKYAV